MTIVKFWLLSVQYYSYFKRSSNLVLRILFTMTDRVLDPPSPKLRSTALFYSVGYLTIGWREMEKIWRETVMA
jgi:hypothetical protein